MAHPEQKRSSFPILWVFGIAILIALVFFLRSFTRERVEVKVAPASYQELTATVSTNGRVEPVDLWQAHAPAPGGVVQRIYVNEGEHVDAGELVVRMDDADAKSRLASAEAALAQAQLQLSDIERGGSTEELGTFSNTASSARLEQQAASANLKALKILQQKGSAAASEVAAAQQRLDAANLALANAVSHSTSRYGASERESAQARVSDAKAAVEAARNALANDDIRTPISGTAYSIPVSESDFVHDGDDLMDVADLTKLQVRAYFDEPEIGKLAVGQPVEIVWPAKPGVVWHGHVMHTPTTIKEYQSTRNVGECIISVEDATGNLAPNASVTVTVTEATRSGVLSIPREALHTDGARNYVYRIVDGKLQQTMIEPGLVNYTNVEIVGGLKPNEKVVLGATASGKELSNGLAVKPVQ
jgi:HlyD family secretion protein